MHVREGPSRGVLGSEGFGVGGNQPVGVLTVDDTVEDIGIGVTGPKAGACFHLLNHRLVNLSVVLHEEEVCRLLNSR
jgi:hypothetical protein